MRKVGVILGVLLFAGTAQAGQLSCTGNVLDYNVSLRARMSGARFTSQARVVITHGRETLKQLSIRVTHSEFVRNRLLNFRGTGKDGQFAVATSWNGTHYVGSVDASGQQGHISFPAACSVR